MANSIILPSREIAKLNDYFTKIDSAASDCFQFLSSHKEGMSYDAYMLLKGDIAIYFQDGKKISTYFWNFGRNVNEENSRLLSTYVDPIWTEQLKQDLGAISYIVKSEAFATLIINQYVFDSCIIANRQFDFRKCFDDLSAICQGRMRESVLFYLLFSYNGRRNQTDPKFHIEKAIDHGLVVDSMLVNKLRLLSQSLFTGKQAFDFSLLDNHGQTIHLSDYKGKVVLLDFWYSNCGPCAQVHPYLEQIRKKYMETEFVLIAISVDRNKEVWLKSIADGIRTSKDAVNLYTGGNGAASQVIQEYKVDGFPTLVLIDREGIVISSNIDPRVDEGKNLNDLIQKALLE